MHPQIIVKNIPKCNKDTAPTFSFRNAHFYHKNIQNCHSNSFELKCLQSSILWAVQLFLLFSEKRSVLMKSNLCFGKRFRAVKNLCKNSSICTKDTAPTFFTWDSRNPSDTAHTNSSHEQLPVTKKLSAVFVNLMRKEECYE